MARLSPKDLLGREVYASDGAPLGAIRAVSWKEANLFDGKVVIGNRDCILMALLQDLALDGERLMLKRSTREWMADSIPLYC